MKKFLMFLMAVIVAITLSACGGQGDGTTVVVKHPSSSGVQVTLEREARNLKGGGWFYIYSLSLFEDGTRCVVLQGSRSGGISCDWK